VEGGSGLGLDVTGRGGPRRASVGTKHETPLPSSP
jgi:hypothetical protein